MVVDEAHRATREHHYVQVVRKIHEKHKNFRIIGLTATPEKQKFCDIATNLHIQDIVYYPMNHPDIKKHHVEEKFEVVDLTPTQQLMFKYVTEMIMAIINLRNLPLGQG